MPGDSINIFRGQASSSLNSAIFLQSCQCGMIQDGLEQWSTWNARVNAGLHNTILPSWHLLGRKSRTGRSDCHGLVIDGLLEGSILPTWSQPTVIQLENDGSQAQIS